jgi:hypothetical protein
MGRVVVRFVIDSDGVVSVARNGGSDLPDSGVNVCVTERLSTLRFPAPERGIVQALYTFQFAPEPRAVRRGRE